MSQTAIRSRYEPVPGTGKMSGAVPAGVLRRTVVFCATTALATACILALPGTGRAQTPASATETNNTAAATAEKPARATTGPMHGIAMHGQPALPRGFSHLPYANPDAPKGGALTVGFQGTFDSLNPFNLKAGSAARGIRGNVYQTLMMRSDDEPFTLYGLIAKSIETDKDRTWVIFRLNPKARFSDGKPLTAKDVKFSFELLREKGRPQHRSAFSLVKSITTPDAHTVRYDLAGANDRELPLILALMPVLPAHATDVKEFPNATLKIPVGSGPYILEEVRQGELLRFRRNKDYWAKDLPVHRGFYNFDELRIEYFRDGNALFEAFKAGIIDYREENDSTRWLNAYGFPAIRDGRIIKKALPLGGAKGMTGFAFNTRRAKFGDVRVREALAMLFDFEWINRNIHGNLFKRTRSFFDNSEMASTGRPASQTERDLLAQWPGAVRKDILEGKYAPPVSDGSGRDRSVARKAMKLLHAAGYRLNGDRLVHAKTGKPLTFELLVSSREQERLALMYTQTLTRIGVQANVNMVDQVQYQRRRQKFEFDMIMGWWIASNSPGNEQRNRWSSAAAKVESSFNLSGARSPAIDGLIEKMLAATDRKEFVTIVRAYDRVLQSGFYIVPLFHKPNQWIAYSSKLAYPKKLPAYATPLFGETLDTWWRKPQ